MDVLNMKIELWNVVWPQKKQQKIEIVLYVFYFVDFLHAI